MRVTSIVLLAAVLQTIPATALAQRFPFERSLDVSETVTLDVATVRGKIDVTAGAPGRVVVVGTVTVRIGWNVPANAVELAREVAANPPIQRDGKTIRLRPPSDDAQRRAVTVAYRVQVPPETEVISDSDSGATVVRGVAGPVRVRTQSSAIDLWQLGGSAGVTTGSGAVNVSDVAGQLTVSTSSSAFTGRSLKGGVRVRTQSGAINADISGPGGVSVETGSSAINLRGVQGALSASTRSGRVSVIGVPHETWDVSTGSGGVDIDTGSAISLAVEATTGSGSVKVTGAPVDGFVSKRKVTGTIRGGGPLVRVTSRSGSVVVATDGR